MGHNCPVFDRWHLGTWGKSSFIPAPYPPLGGSEVGLCQRLKKTFPSRAVDTLGGR
jgi:hypothetical protein